MAWAPDYTWGPPPELYTDEVKEAVLEGWGDGVLLDLFAPSYAGMSGCGTSGGRFSGSAQVRQWAWQRFRR